jgi:hypothetical protein
MQFSCIALFFRVVELWKFPLYLVCDLTGHINVHQWTMIHSRTVPGDFAALAGLVEQFGPVGE